MQIEEDDIGIKPLCNLNPFNRGTLGKDPVAEAVKLRLQYPQSCLIVIYRKYCIDIKLPVNIRNNFKYLFSPPPSAAGRCNLLLYS